MKLKRVFVYLLLLNGLYACDSSNIVHTRLPEEQVAAPAEKEKESSSAQPDTTERLAYINAKDLALIRNNSAPMQEKWEVNFETLETGAYKAIPDEFLAKYIYGLPVKASFEGTIAQEAYAPAYFHTYKEVGDLLLFSIIQSNEYCCYMVYGITVEKASNKIADAALLTLSGGDGNWYRIDTGSWTNDSTFVVAKVDAEVLEMGQSGEVVIKDSVQQQLRLSRQGQWTKIVLDSLHLVDTVYRQ